MTNKVLRKTSTGETSNNVIKDYFKKEKAVLSIFGVSFAENETKTYNIYRFFCYLLINVLYPVLDFREVFVNEFDVVADMIMYLMGTFLGSVKLFVTLKNRKKFARIMHRLEEKPFTPNFERGGPEEQTIINNCLWIVNIQNLIYWFGGIISIIGGITAAVVSRLRTDDPHKWILPYGAFTILNTTYSPNYEITCAYQNISLTWIIGQFMSIDLICIGILAHISFQFKMLQNNFRRVVKNSWKIMTKENNRLACSSSQDNQNVRKKTDNSVIPWKYLRKSLKQAVSYHIAVFDMAKEMEDVLSNMLLMMFLCTLCMLGFLIFRASTMTFDDSRMLKSAGEIMTCSMQIATVCYWGNQVMVESQEIATAIFETDFVGTNLKFQKALVLVMSRSQYPTKLTAGKFADISLSSFTWFLQMSYSAFMVLHTRNKNKLDL